MAGKDIAVEFDVPDITIKGDENLLHQVWSNILRIALSFQTMVERLSFSSKS